MSSYRGLTIACLPESRDSAAFPLLGLCLSVSVRACIFYCTSMYDLKQVAVWGRNAAPGNGRIASVNERANASEGKLKKEREISPPASLLHESYEMSLSPVWLTT